jgi:hypothetical protein
MLLTASVGKDPPPHRLGIKWGAPHSLGLESQNYSLRPNEMGCPHRIGRERHNPPSLGRKWDAPQSIGMRCLNPSLRPNEMSELLAASESNGMLLIAAEGKPQPPIASGGNGTPIMASE